MQPNQQQSPAQLPAVHNENQPPVVEDFGPLAYLLDSRRFDHLKRIATLMSCSTLTPKHLRGTTPNEAMANCFRVANQALRWGFDPFAICDETYVVAGRLGYQGKLVAAVINARAGLKERLSYEFTGTGDDRTVTVSGEFKGESYPRTKDLSVRQAKTGNEMWTKNPDQKLVYSGAIAWARMHCPEIMLGVLTDDDLERINEKRIADDKPPVGKWNLREMRNHGLTTEQMSRPLDLEERPEEPTAPPPAKAPTTAPEPAAWPSSTYAIPPAAPAPASSPEPAAATASDPWRDSLVIKCDEDIDGTRNPKDLMQMIRDLEDYEEQLGEHYQRLKTKAESKLEDLERRATSQARRR